MITKRRSLAKSITWRLIAIAVTFIVGFVMTGSWQFAVSLSLISNLINFVLYYIHERFWLKINWGRK
ncbi:MAG: DUF2061 domain-containing protein [Actinobacteria bacterium]|uniref:Unannotated protein n=1 Tax=freshwater metagenome TaxID=449393 RepID=A0A6J6IXF2_9ZZZZ|nr:DUF2061 domain-containing protein [Micrococcales bacterium]MSZ35600.1 DUF2061 domain-containing protein [Actinomycetota bacterium]